MGPIEGVDNLHSAPAARHSRSLGIIPRNRRQKLRKFTQLTSTARQTLVPGLIDRVKRGGLSHRPALQPPGATYVYVDGEPCKFFVFGHVVLGDRELENESLIEVEPDAKRFSFRPQTGFGASTTPTRFIILSAAYPTPLKRLAVTSCSTPAGGPATEQAPSFHRQTQWRRSRLLAECSF
jgi:hypothetical protein